MTPRRLIPIACGFLLVAVACSQPNDPYTSLDSFVSLATTNNMGEEDDSGGETYASLGTGDGDGDSADGETTGPGDGDSTDEGDGDGDGDDSGDGDGDGVGNCGWDPDSQFYACGFMGEDPSHTFPIACPCGLVDGAPCGSVTGLGCCDADGNNWYCSVEDTLVLDECAP